MNMQMCSKGHFYDADVYRVCPACANGEPEGDEFPQASMATDFPSTGSYMTAQETNQYPRTAPVGVGVNQFPRTAPVSAEVNQFPRTAPINAEANAFPRTAPVSAGVNQFPRTAPVGVEVNAFPRTVPVAGQEGLSKTMPIGGVSQSFSSGSRNPVLGWLVCTQGKKQGKDFRLTQERNYVGRAGSNDVCLDFDEAVSWDTTIMIAYIKGQCVFKLDASQSRNPVYVNEVPVMGEYYLRDRDIISIGTTELMLVCFCNASFEWEL